MNTNNLKDFLASTHVEDILGLGFFDANDQPTRFHLLTDRYILRCENGDICFSAIKYTGKGVITQPEIIEPVIDPEDGFQPAIASLGAVLLREPDGSTRISSVSLWDANDTALGVECSAMRLVLHNGQVIFFDPSYHFGIRIGGADQESIWVENLIQTPKAVTLF